MGFSVRVLPIVSDTCIQYISFSDHIIDLPVCWRYNKISFEIYEQIVEERRNEYPKPRDVDKKLKEALVPFRWQGERGRYSLSLDAGTLNQDSFAKYGMLGNGYDWEKAASAFAEVYRWNSRGRFHFDCEADTFSMQSSSKKFLKEFALAFHKCVMDAGEFEELLKG